MRDRLYFKWQWIRQKLGFPPPVNYVEAYSVDARQAETPAGDLGQIFFAHEGRGVHKWVHFLDLYDRHLSSFRQQPVRLLEIGVARGGSLELWRKYLGPQATIFGIDVDPRCVDRVDPPNHVRIGSQDDPAFLRAVVEEMGGVDIIIDDGSHVAPHQKASFEILYPLLSNGGIYAVEDTHTAYWPGDYKGGYGRKGTAIEMVKRMVDDLHGWWHQRPHVHVPRDQIGGIHIYDSLFFIEKLDKHQPQVVLTRR